MKATALVLAFALLPGLVRGEEKLPRPAEHLLERALRMARATRVQDRLREKLLEEASDLSDQDLRSVVDRLRAEVKPLKSLPEIRALLVGVYVKRIYGAEAEKRLPHLLDRMALVSIEGQLELLGDALMLEDLKLARELALKDATSKISLIRCRAALALGGIVTWGAGTPEVTAALTKLLDDPDGAVRALACRAGFHARLDAVYPWAVAHLDDGQVGVAKLGDAEKTFRPGEEALTDLVDLTWVDVEPKWDTFRFLKDQQKKTIAGLFTAWWDQHGKTFPVPGFREATFRRQPSRTEKRILAKGDTSVSFQFWAGIDRTKIRLSIENLAVVAITAYDWQASFEAHYMAQGMRSDDGEGYAREHPLRKFYVLARKAIGCYVLTFRPLFDGRVEVRLLFHDPLR